MEEHLRNVSQFHETLKTFTDWLNTQEIQMRSYKYPSKLVDTVTKQIREHDVGLQFIESILLSLKVISRKSDKTEKKGEIHFFKFLWLFQT